MHEGKKEVQGGGQRGKYKLLVHQFFFLTGNGVEDYIQHQYQETQSVSNHSINNYAAGKKNVYFQAHVDVWSDP